MPERDSELVLVEVAGELLAYDRKNGKTHCLAPMAAKVFEVCDGRSEAEAHAALVGDHPELSLELLQGICAELMQRKLVAFGEEKKSRMPRRAFLSSAAAAALFVSAAMPTPAAAASTCVTNCTGTVNTGRVCRANCANPPNVPATFCYRCYSLTGFEADGETALAAGQPCVFQFNTGQCLTDIGNDQQPDCGAAYTARNTGARDDAWCCINTGAQNFTNAAGGNPIAIADGSGGCNEVVP